MANSHSRTTTRQHRDPDYRQNNKGSNYGDILGTNTSDSSDALVQLLHSLGIGSSGDITGTDRKDWNKQLLDTLVSHISTVENRQYNEGLRNEQRIYDLPTNQLARLMGAGISRDMALQMLSGSSQGSGGSGVPYSDPSAIAEGIAPSQSDLNHAQATAAKLQSGLGFVQAVSGLVGLGFSAAQAIPQINLLKNQEYLSNKQRAAFDDAGTAFRLITKGGNVTKDTFGSMKSVSESINTLAQGGDLAAKAFVDQGGLDRLRQNGIYSLPFMNQMYKNELEPNYYSRQVESALRLQESQSNLAAVNADKALVEMDEINAKIENLDADTDYKAGLESLLTWQADNIKADTSLKNEESNSIHLDNVIKKQFQNTITPDGQTGLQLFTDASIARLRRELFGINAEIGSKVWDVQVKTLLADQRNLQQLYALQYLYNKGELDAVSESAPQYQQFLYLSRSAESCGVFDYVSTIADIETKGNINGYSHPAYRALDALESFEDSREPKSTFDKIINYKPFMHK